jgi:hypothetical protein
MPGCRLLEVHGHSAYYRQSVAGSEVNGRIRINWIAILLAGLCGTSNGHANLIAHTRVVAELGLPPVPVEQVQELKRSFHVVPSVLSNQIDERIAARG